MQKNSLFIILGNHLFPYNFLDKYKNCNVFMAEDLDLCTYQKHHKLKIAFFLTSMRNYRDSLKQKNYKVNYFSIDGKNKELSYEDKILKVIEKKKINNLFFYEIEDKFFENKIFKFIKKNKLDYTILQSPMFLNNRLDFKDYLSSVKKPFMSTYYKQQRIKHNILLDKDNGPIGDKWSFDDENRKKIPKNILLPALPLKKTNNNFESIKYIVNEYFYDHPGSLDNFWLETDRLGVKKSLKEFILKKFKFFGDYEDASIKNNTFLFHSLLSPYLNNGLITPREILDVVLSNDVIKKIPLNSLEGFIRQIIGWREFIRGIYQNYSNDIEAKNFYGNKRKLTKHWYDGTTGIDPIDDAIKDINKFGYAHHIIRLMFLSNVMNLSGIDPKEIYRWFMEMFVDSSDWVMSPNVFGMGTYSDGGTFSTKPYICGSNYIIKMSNYKKGKWSEIVDGLYWNFISLNITSIRKNPRMTMINFSFNKIGSEKLKNHIKIAKQFIKNKTSF